MLGWAAAVCIALQRLWHASPLHHPAFLHPICTHCPPPSPPSLLAAPLPGCGEGRRAVWEGLGLPFRFSHPLCPQVGFVFSGGCEEGGDGI